ncbi:MAG TPA: YbaB/EbfC family nucleoid-associated protein [Micromonosporaceae bacterium]|jgi:DNA-binding protein YbaB
MAREIDEAFIEEAIERYRRIDERLADFAKLAASTEVTVHSPDGLVTIVVAVDGGIRDIDIDERLLTEHAGDASQSLRLAVAAAADAAAWARTKLRAETFAGYDPIGRA